MVLESSERLRRLVRASVQRWTNWSANGALGTRPRKIAHLLRKYDPSSWGGTESAVLELLKGLREYGIESVVFAPYPFRSPGLSAGWTPSPDDPFSAAGFVVRRFSAFLPTFGISRSDRERSIAVGGNIMSLSAPLMLLTEPNVDIIHAHALGRMGAIARTVAHLRRIPYAVSIHGGFLDLPDPVRETLSAPTAGGFEWGRVFGWAMGARRVVSDADSVITCNPQEASLLTRKLPQKRIALLPHGIRVGRFHTDCREIALSRWPQLAGRNVLLCVGRIDSIKNQVFAVRALQTIIKQFPNVLLVLAGAETDPVHAAEVHQAIREQDLSSYILMTGNLGHKDPALVGLYQIAEAVVLPSLSETFGMVILEAWAAGKAVVVSDTSGARQIVRHCENGMFFDLNHPQSFVDSVSLLLSQPQLAASWGHQGHLDAVAHYSSPVVAAKFVKLYREMWDCRVR